MMPRPCNRCNRPIKWSRHVSGKWMPFDPDGSPHWWSCKRTSRAAALANAPLTSPGTTTRGCATKLYTGTRPPWLFDRWEWVEPSGELRYRARCQEGSYQGDADLFGDLDKRYEQIMKGAA